MAEKQSLPPTKPVTRMTVESNSKNSVIEDASTIQSVKNIVIETHENKNENNDNKDNDENNDDFVEMEQILHDVIETKQEDSPRKMSHLSHIEVSIPNKRLSNKFRQNRHKRPGGSSIMGSQNIMGNSLLKLKIPEIDVNEDSKNSHSGHSVHSVHSGHSGHIIDNDSIIGNDNDGINDIIEILKKDINDRIKAEIDILVNYFEQFQIISDDIYSGHYTFRALIQETKYLFLNANDKIGDKNNDNLCFYFILSGTISSYNKNQVFGFNEIYNLDKSCNNYISETGVHLAYWDIDTYNQYIRPIKELNTDIAQEQTLLHDKYGNLLTENDLIEKASMFLDVIHGRDFKMHRNGKLPKKVHKFFNLKWTRYFLIFICLLWLFCIQFEPPSTIYDTNPKTTQYKHIINILIFEWIVFVILLIECLLRFYSFGRKWFFKDHLLHKMRVLLFIY
eukprot:11432_1